MDWLQWVMLPTNMGIIISYEHCEPIQNVHANEPFHAELDYFRLQHLTRDWACGIWSLLDIA